MVRAVLAIIILAILSADGHAITQEKRNVLEHIGQVFAGAELCSRIAVDVEAVGAVYLFFKIDLDDPTQYAVVLGKGKEAIEAMRGRGESFACTASMLLYGPEGENVPGLLRWK